MYSARLSARPRSQHVPELEVLSLSLVRAWLKLDSQSSMPPQAAPGTAVLPAVAAVAVAWFYHASDFKPGRQQLERQKGCKGQRRTARLLLPALKIQELNAWAARASDLVLGLAPRVLCPEIFRSMICWSLRAWFL